MVDDSLHLSDLADHREILRDVAHSPLESAEESGVFLERESGGKL